MKAKYIKCPTCEAAPSSKSVDLELELEPCVLRDGISTVVSWAAQLECVNGHHFIFGVRDKDKPPEAMAYEVLT